MKPEKNLREATAGTIPPGTTGGYDAKDTVLRF